MEGLKLPVIQADTVPVSDGEGLKESVLELQPLEDTLFVAEIEAVKEFVTEEEKLCVAVEDTTLLAEREKVPDAEEQEEPLALGEGEALNENLAVVVTLLDEQPEGLGLGLALSQLEEVIVELTERDIVTVNESEEEPVTDIL